MMSLSDTSLVEEERADVDGVDRDGAEQEGGAADPDCLNLNYASLGLMVVTYMAHMKVKCSDIGKGTEKWRKIFMVAELKISLSQVAVSLNTFIRERIKCEGKSIVRCSNKEAKIEHKAL